MTNTPMDLKYTLVFINDYRSRFTDYQGNQQWLLLLNRRHPPNQGLWNGVGGKILPGERPVDCAMREAREETGLELDNLRFGGIVTWDNAPEGGKGGMYVYISCLPLLEWDNWQRWHRLETDEGQLAWWMVDELDDLPLVDNIPHFLPDMLAGVNPVEHHCIYDENGLLVTVEQLPLTIDLTGVEAGVGRP